MVFLVSASELDHVKMRAIDRLHVVGQILAGATVGGGRLVNEHCEGSTQRPRSIRHLSRQEHVISTMSTSTWSRAIVRLPVFAPSLLSARARFRRMRQSANRGQKMPPESRGKVGVGARIPAAGLAGRARSLARHTWPVATRCSCPCSDSRKAACHMLP